MTSLKEEAMCIIAPLPIGQFHFPNESHDYVVVLIDCDWSRKVTRPNSKAIAVFNWIVFIRWYYLINTRVFLVVE